jgi:renalase
MGCFSRRATFTLSYLRLAHARVVPSVAPVTTAVESPAPVDALVIGAGMAGLVAARTLRDAGQRVVVLEKGRGVGGRIATRRMGPAVFDHGAQFLTTRDPRFCALVEHWREQATVTEWCRGFGGSSDGHVRWRGVPGMTAVPKALAAALDVRVDARVLALRRVAGGWKVERENGPPLTAAALVVTAPVPQALDLLDAGQVAVPAALRRRLEAITYERCLAVMATLEEGSGLMAPGARSIDDGPVAWLADNQIKRVSPEPAITLHATPTYSLANWDRDRNDVGRELLEAVAPLLRAAVKEFQVHGWRYSRPVSPETGGALVLSEDPPLLLAGDAFCAPRIEGAALSGWAAAERLLQLRRLRN